LKYRELVELVGEEAARTLSEALGGARVWIPNRYAPRREARDVSICQAYARGESVEQIGERYGLQVRSVLKIVSRRG